MVVRIAVGGYIKGGPWHSANVESFFAHIPGWYVVYPSCAEDAKGLIKAAARSKDPVIFLEHKGLYRRVQAKTPEPDADYVVPFGKGAIRREGKDLTVVTWGSTVYMALELARQMEKDGVSLEVIDLRSIVPLDEDSDLPERAQDQSRHDRPRRYAHCGIRRGSGGAHRGKLYRFAGRPGSAGRRQRHIRPFGAESRVGCAPFGRRVAAWG